jgi:hypothetical protein
MRLNRSAIIEIFWLWQKCPRVEDDNIYSAQLLADHDDRRGNGRSADAWHAKKIGKAFDVRTELLIQESSTFVNFGIGSFDARVNLSKC